VGIGIGIVLIAVGAVLTWAVTADAEGLDVNAIGVILMVVGALAVLLSLLVFERWSPVRRRRAYVAEGPRDVVVEDRAVEREVVVERPVRRTTVVEEDDVGPGPPGP
jgi:hypothetical protein